MVPEAFEGSIMLASHALALIGVPINRVIRRIREIRNQRYELMRGFFHGMSDEQDGPDAQQPRLHAVVVAAGADVIGRTLAELELELLDVKVSAIRRRNIRGWSPAPETVVAEGDVLVLLGVPGNLELAETRIPERG